MGSPVAATDNLGAVAGTQSFYPFGEVRSATGLFDTERSFTGQIFDGGTGLGFYNARYYDSALGRFISPDSIVPDPATPALFNKFAYVENNPLVFVDPTGFCGETDEAAFESGQLSAEEHRACTRLWNKDNFHTFLRHVVERGDPWDWDSDEGRRAIADAFRPEPGKNAVLVSVADISSPTVGVGYAEGQFILVDSTGDFAHGEFAAQFAGFDPLSVLDTGQINVELTNVEFVRSLDPNRRLNSETYSASLPGFSLGTYDTKGFLQHEWPHFAAGPLTQPVTSKGVDKFKPKVSGAMVTRHILGIYEGG